MKKDKNIQPEQQNKDNGWKPRMKTTLGDDKKEHVLDLQQELMMKAYPTRESRAKERQNGGNPELDLEPSKNNGNFADTRDDYGAGQGSTPQYDATPSSYVTDEDAETGGEVYTRLGKPKEKNMYDDGPKHVYKKMPSATEHEEAKAKEEKQKVSEKPQGLGRAYTVEAKEEPEKPVEKPEEKPQQKQTNVLEALDRLFGNDTPAKIEPEAPKEPVVETYDVSQKEEEEEEEDVVVETASKEQLESFKESSEPEITVENYEEEKEEEEEEEEKEEEEIETIEQSSEEAKPKEELTVATMKASDLFDMPFDGETVIPGTFEAHQKSLNTTKIPKADPFNLPPIHFSKGPVELPEWAQKLKKEKEEEDAKREALAKEESAKRVAATRKEQQPVSSISEELSKKIADELGGETVAKKTPTPEETQQDERDKEDKELDELMGKSTMLDDIFSEFSKKSKKKRNILPENDNIEDEIDAKLAALTGTQRRRPLHEQQKIGVNTGVNNLNLHFEEEPKKTRQDAERRRRMELAKKQEEMDAEKKAAQSSAVNPVEIPKAEPKKTDAPLLNLETASEPKKNRPRSLAAAMEEEEGPKKPKEKTFSRLMRMIKPYIPMMIASLFVTLVSVGLQLYMPFLTGKIIDNAIGEGQVKMSAIQRMLLIMLAVIVVSVIAQWLMEVFNNRITFSIIKDIRLKAFNHLQNLPLKYIDGKKQGELINCIMTDVDQISDGLLLGFSQIFSGMITIVGTLVFMLIVDWRVAIAVIVLTPLSLVVASQIAKRTFHMFQKQSQDRADLAAHVEEMISNQKVVVAFGREASNIERFDDLNTELSKSSRKATFFSSITNPSTRFVNSVVYAVVGVLGAAFGIRGSMTIGDISCFLTYAKQYTKPFNEISGVIAEFQNALASASRVFDLLDEIEESEEKATIKEVAHVEGQVSLSHVKFSYNPKKPLITDFNLEVDPGKRIAIVGPTGCGKTTLINLLMRFYDIDGGQIRIDSKDTKRMTREALRANFGMVLQETWIRSGTIEENIAIGNPGATHEQVVEAAKAVHAHSFIRRLPQGYQTVLSEGGDGLSQGQKQLLCIARVMLKKPPMLILDEATSSIDSRTEIQVQMAFDELMKGRTSFVVAHRLSTIKEADVILVMKDGNIIEQGSHDELLAKGGFYYDLFQSQYAH